MLSICGCFLSSQRGGRVLEMRTLGHRDLKSLLKVTQLIAVEMRRETFSNTFFSTEEKKVNIRERTGKSFYQRPRSGVSSDASSGQVGGSWVRAGSQAGGLECPCVGEEPRGWVPEAEGLALEG